MAVNETGVITLKMLAVDLASGNVGKFIGNIDRLAKQGGLMGSVMQGVGMSFGQMLNPAKLVARGIGAVTDALGDSLQAARDDQLSVDHLTASLKANVEGWDGSTRAIEHNIEKGQALAFTDDALRESLALLVGATHDVSEAQRTQNVAMDLARFKRIDLRTASEALIKVEAGQFRMLKTLGIELRKGATATEALAAVQKVAAGQAETYAKTSTGAAEVLNIKMGELSESFGRFLMGPADLFVRFLDDVVTGIGNIDEALGGSARSQLEFQDLMYELGRSMGFTEEETQRLWDQVRLLGFAFPASATAAEQMAGMLETLRRAMHDANIGAQVAGRGIGEAFKVPVKSVDHLAVVVRQTTFKMLQSLEEAREPWRAGWKQLAAWAKNPFTPAKFEDWIAGRVRVAMQKAHDMAKPEPVRRRWLAIAKAMSSPIFAALVDLGMSVDEAVAKIMALQRLARRIDPLSIVVTGAGLGNSQRTGTRSPYTLPRGGGDVPNGSSAQIVINLNGLVAAPSEADGQRIARMLAPALQRHARAQGAF